MKRFVTFLIHNHKNEFPQRYIRIFEGESEDSIKELAIAFAIDINRANPMVTAFYMGIMTTQEAKSYIEDLLDSSKYGNCNEDQEANFWEMYEECYGTKQLQL